MIYIVVEGETDKLILQKLLPLQPRISFLVGGGRSGAISMATTLLSTHHKPVVLVVDADSLQKDVISERTEFPKYLMEKASFGVQYLVAVPIPEIETLLIANRVLLEEMAGRTIGDFEWKAAQRDPKGFLQELGLPIQAVLAKLQGQKIEHPLLEQITNFLESVNLAHAA